MRVDDDLEPEQAVRLLEVEYGNAAPSLDTLKDERRLFSVICTGRELYPAFQWCDGRMIPAMQTVLSVLGPHWACWKILAWFTTANERLADASPAEVLPFRPEAVLAAARLELQVRLSSSGTTPTSGERADEEASNDRHVMVCNDFLYDAAG